MIRTPVTLSRPDCYARFLSEESCQSCKHRSECVKLSKYFDSQTVIDGMVSEDELITKKSASCSVHMLADFFFRSYRELGGTMFLRNLTPTWKKALTQVIETCDASGIDPRLYVKAQVETIGKWAIKNNRPFYPNLFQGRNAQGRFEEWIERNRRLHADAHHMDGNRDQKAVDLLTAESEFLTTYLNGDMKAAAAEKIVQRIYPDWSLKVTRPLTNIRIAALNQFMVSLSFALPRQLVLKDKTFKWGTVKKELMALFN